jgi:hypothetical protein
LASAQAIAWCRPKSKVRLQWMASSRGVGGADAFPCRGELDEDALPADALLLVHAISSRALAMLASVSCENAGIDLGRYAAGHDVEDAVAELDRQRSMAQSTTSTGLQPRPFSCRDQPRASSTTSAYCGICAAAVRSGRVGRGVARLELLDRLEVTGVGDHDGHGLELVEETGHGQSITAVRLVTPWFLD